ncbi:MAG TPA: hypothetical protein VE219_02560 [Candidatus Sulfotelmatobacter sp.]|nr:hypothetical protein [Candidatus Sulfotelmatobacter sp.]
MADRARHRFSAWDGTQNPLEADSDALFERLSEDVFSGWDVETALRRLLGQGWRDRQGRRVGGLDDIMEQLRRRRQQQLRRYNLDGVFTNIKERLDKVVRLEREGMEQRLAAAEDAGRRLLERVVAKRREELDALPPDPGGAIRALHDYEFMDSRAQEAFRKLVDELRKTLVDSYFQDMAAQLKSMSSQDVSQMREMMRDLNSLLQAKLNGATPEQLQRDYQRFLGRWGAMFPNAPETFEEFLEHLQRQLARMDSLMRSLDPGKRRELDELIGSLFGNPELRAEMADLAAALELLSPTGQIGSRFSFFGDEEVSLEGAMQLMERLQTLEALEQGIRDMYAGNPLDRQLREALAEALGPEAAQDLARVGEMSQALEERGLVQRTDEGLQLTPRGMRRIGQKALGDVFSRLRRDRFGEHELRREGHGGERADDSKPYEFGDHFDLDVEETVMNSLQRRASSGLPRGAARLAPQDFTVHRTETMTRSATVLMLDMSRSMPLRGYFYAAKKVAVALDWLIRSQYPRDSLHVIGFSLLANEIRSSSLAQLGVDEYVYGTNLQHGLVLARRLLSRHQGENKQIIVVTDGEPTAHLTDDGSPQFSYPPVPETFHKTLLEVKRCTRENIVINTFMLDSSYRLVQFVNEVTRLNRGRAFFVSPERLGDYVLVDFVNSRQKAA